MECHNQKEREAVFKEYNESGLVPSGYKIITPDIGATIVYKDMSKDKSAEELKALIDVEQAKNICSIKKYVLFFVVLTIISMAIALVYIITVFTNYTS